MRKPTARHSRRGKLPRCAASAACRSRDPDAVCNTRRNNRITSSATRGTGNTAVRSWCKLWHMPVVLAPGGDPRAGYPGRRVLRGPEVVTGKSPTVRQRELGKRLRDLRNQHELTVEDVAEKLLCSATKVSRLETGVRRPSLRDVRDLCVLYGVDESTTTDLLALARGAREPGWWTKYEDLKLDPLIGLEQDAAAITCFSMYYIPALLQTADYARAIIGAIAPKIDPQILEQRVEARMRRQQLLDGPNRPRYRVLLDEALLHRRVGGAELMAAQLDTLLQAARLNKVTIQIIPFDVGAHAAADGYFIFWSSKIRICSQSSSRGPDRHRVL